MTLRVTQRLALISVALLFIGAVVVPLSDYFAEGYVWDRDINNQTIIGKAYVAFYVSRKQCPTNPEVLVQSGFLPQKGTFYVEPPIRGNARPDVGSSCYVVQPPPSGSIEDLKMIARRTLQGNKELLRFDPVANAFIRDEIIKGQIPRDERAYSNYIAPLEVKSRSAH